MHVQIASKHKLRTVGTTQLRCIQPAEYLRSRGFRVTLSHLYKSIPNGSDVLLLHRVMCDNFTEQYIKYAKARGTIVVYDTDDLIFSESGADYLKRINRGWYTSSKEINPYRQAMSLCDVILVSVPFLALQAKQFHADVRVIRNALSNEYFQIADNVYKSRTRKQKEEEVTIAYLSGSSSHDYDFKLVEQSLLELLSTDSRVRVLLVGPLNYSLEFLNFDRFTHMTFVDYSNFPKLFYDIDINLISLETDQPFCQAKSELKYIEAGACGIPSVVSPTEVFSEIIKDKSNGILVKNENWVEAIRYLIDNPSRRAELGNAARNHIVSDYSPTSRAKEWEGLVCDITNRYGRFSKRAVITPDKLALRLKLEGMRCVRKAASLKGRFGKIWDFG